MAVTIVDLSAQSFVLCDSLLLWQGGDGAETAREPKKELKSQDSQSHLLDLLDNLSFVVSLFTLIFAADNTITYSLQITP